MPIAHINGHDMYYEVHGEGPRPFISVAGIRSVTGAIIIWREE